MEQSRLGVQSQPPVTNLVRDAGRQMDFPATNIQTNIVSHNTFFKPQGSKLTVPGALQTNVLIVQGSAFPVYK